MKQKQILILILVLCSLACQKTTVRSSAVENKSTSEESTGNEAQDDDEKVWVPIGVQKCIAGVETPEPFELETLFNPYYLRADFDGNEGVDYAILVRSVKEKTKRGLVICKDSKESFFFSGSIAKSKDPLSDMSDDNFVTKRWEILSRNETRTITKDSDEKKIGNDAKGESIGFFFEGGGFIVYWDGKKFTGVGGS